MNLDPVSIIERFYTPGTSVYDILIRHSRIVMEKSLSIAENVRHLHPDTAFIQSAAMLHDIGIFLTRSESIGCRGQAAYICHGYLGRNLLDDLGLPPEYGLVCERHTGAGITLNNILTNDLPLPPRDMVPASLEEKIICVADKYHSKNPRLSHRTLSTPQIVEELEKIGKDHARRFTAWADEFSL